MSEELGFQYTVDTFLKEKSITVKNNSMSSGIKFEAEIGVELGKAEMKVSFMGF